MECPLELQSARDGQEGGPVEVESPKLQSGSDGQGNDTGDRRDAFQLHRLREMDEEKMFNALRAQSGAQKRHRPATDAED